MYARNGHMLRSARRARICGPSLEVHAVGIDRGMCMHAAARTVVLSICTHAAAANWPMGLQQPSLIEAHRH